MDTYEVYLKHEAGNVLPMEEALGIFENGKQIIATAEIANMPKDLDFELSYIGYQQLEVQQNKRVYEEYIRFLIREKLREVKVLDKYRKYSLN